MNDKLMIQNAGIGIAMGQSTPRIKEIADYVTNDNDNDGVKNAIQYTVPIEDAVEQVRSGSEPTKNNQYYRNVTII